MKEIEELSLEQREKLVDRFMSKVKKGKKEDDCWLWQAYTGGYGYGRIRIGGAARAAHRVSYTLFVGFIPSGLWVLHTCDVPGCVNPNHLYVGTAAENVQDMCCRGRSTQLLTAEQVCSIRKQLRDDVKLTYRQLAEELTVGRTVVRDAARGITHAHVAEPLAPNRPQGHRVTKTVIVKVRSAHRQGVLGKHIAVKYGVSECTVSCIINNHKRYANR